MVVSPISQTSLVINCTVILKNVVASGIEPCAVKVIS